MRKAQTPGRERYERKVRKVLLFFFFPFYIFHLEMHDSELGVAFGKGSDTLRSNDQPSRSRAF